MFAGSCIGVIALVCVLEFLRRLGREYDRFVVSSGSRGGAKRNRVLVSGHHDVEHNHAQKAGSLDRMAISAADTSSSSSHSNGSQGNKGLISGSRMTTFSGPTVVQQVVRSLIHMLQFAVAYFVMLLAMYFNGYIIICIFIGAFVGSFIFGWDLTQRTQEVSGCCG